MSLDIPSLGDFLKAYGFDPPESVEPYRPSVLHATYRLDTPQGTCLVKLFDAGDAVTAQATARWLQCLRTAGIPCPQPYSQPGGACVGRLAGQVALVLDCPIGETLARYTREHCQALGMLLACLHLASRDCGAESAAFSKTRPGRDIPRELGQLPLEEADLLRMERRYQRLHRFDDLPQGLVCGTGIPERILFQKDRVTGLFGLEPARQDTWLLDLAHAVTECCEQDGALDKDRVLALLTAYHQQRPLTPIERGAWPVMLRAAAFQQWVQAIQEGGAGSPRAVMGRSRLRGRIAQEHLFQRFWP